MISKILSSALVAACLAMNGAAFAESHHGHQNSEHNSSARHSAQNNRQGRGTVHPGPSSRDGHARGHDNRAWGHDNHSRGRDNYARGHGHYERGHRTYYGRGAGPHHNYYRGGWVPAQYRQRQYIVHDWHHYHLYAPPRGYYWVQSGSDFLLTAIATGLIAQIILGN
ncbi:RcnB family protein [Allopusillimonas ginsengisoli]|uniref:RcnB family protein n=1 Tax=Allopusillimonas ginsengisoli TaxID=453575 RepID=UPI0039C0A721